MKFRPPTAAAIAVFCSLAMGVSGCKKPHVRVYLAPSETTAATELALPVGWTEAAPNSVSTASYSIKIGGAEANVNITPLPNLAGREAMVVNMWREQAGLAPIEDAELAKTLVPVDIAGKKGQMFEVLGAKEGGAPLRIVTAFYHENGASWFFKLAGDEALVAAQKPVFVEFLKTVQVKERANPPAETLSEPPPEKLSAPPAPAASPTSEFKWKVPDGWQALTPGNMQVGKFAVPEKDGGKGEVFVSIFPNDTGGTLANVNRWCQQLGLPALDDSGLAKVALPLDPATPDAVLIDLKGDARALLGAIVPREGKWWFYKLLGDASAVTAARESFIAFAKQTAE